MSLAALQAALVSVFTDPEARARFAIDPDGFVRSLGLPPAECAQLSALGVAAVSSYARSLGRKRRSDAAAFLPRTRLALAESFAASFERWAMATKQKPGTRRGAVDALAYCNWLSTSEATRGRRETGEAVAWDRHGLRATLRPVYVGFAGCTTENVTLYGVWIKLGRLWHWRMDRKLPVFTNPGARRTARGARSSEVGH